jgi:protein SCO1/2
MRRNGWTLVTAIAVLFLTTAVMAAPATAPTATAPTATAPTATAPTATAPTATTASAPAQTRWGANYFPNVALITQDGKTVHLWDDLLKDKKVVINFIYTDCSASCPLETAKLVQVQNLLAPRMGKDIFFYSITLDPKHDSPKVLKAYAAKFHAGPGWLFLTGQKADIELVRKKFGLAAASFQNELTDHSTRLTIGNGATGQWMQDGAMDDPHYIAMMAGDWLSSWKDRKKGESYTKAQPVEGASDKGVYLFKTRCSACHTVGDGDRIGPDLMGVTAARDHAWLTKYLTAPDEVLASGDPIAKSLYIKYKKVKMPNLRLGDKEIEFLLKFITERSAAKASHTASTSTAKTGAATASSTLH